MRALATVPSVTASVSATAPVTVTALTVPGAPAISTDAARARKRGRRA